MHYFFKISWFVRYLFFKPFFGSYKFPGYFGAPVFLLGVKNAYFGKNVRIFPGARLEIFEDAILKIESDVAIAQNVHITCKKSIVIGAGTCIAANVCVTDIRHTFKNSDSINILGQEDRVSNTAIGKNCFIGYGAVIDSGTSLGDGCVVGANAYVSGVYPPYSVIASDRSKVRFNYYE